MKRLLVLLFAFSLNSHASYLEFNGPLDVKLFETVVNDNKTYLEVLRDMFSKGTLPETSKIKSFIASGRCFEAKNPNQPRASFIQMREAIKSAGPIGQERFEVALIWASGQYAPDYFDNKDIKEIKEVFGNSVDTFDPLIVKENSLTNSTFSIRFRTFENYMIMESRELYCYYFKANLK